MKVLVYFDLGSPGNIRCECPELQEPEHAAEFTAFLLVLGRFFEARKGQAISLSQQGIVRLGYELQEALREVEQNCGVELGVVPLWDQPVTSYHWVDARTGEPW